MNEEEQNSAVEDERMKKSAKNAAVDAGRKTAKAAGKAVKDLIVAIVKAIGIKAAIIVGIVLIIIILLAAFFFKLSGATYERTSSALEMVSTSQNDINNTQNQSKHANVIGIVSINDIDRSIDLNTKEFEDIMTEWFNENHINPSTLGISDDYSDLRAFIQAEITTLYPDFRTRELIGTEVPEGQIQGCIQFHRKFEDGTSQVLEYMPYQDYATEVAKVGLKLDETVTQQQIYTSRADVEAQYNYIKNYFTLDANRNLVVARLTSTETVVTYDSWAEEENRQYRDGTEYNYTFTVDKELINYQAAVEDYAMPFELCMALLMTTHNTDFCMEVANLAKNSSIIVEVQDNVTTTIDTTVYGYFSHFSMREDVTYYTESEEDVEDKDGNPTGEKTKVKEGPKHAWDSTTDSRTITDYETIVTTRYSIVVQPHVTSAETWLASVNIAYSNLVKTEPVTPEPTISEWEADDAASNRVPKYHDSLNYPHINTSGWVDVSITYTTLETRTNKTTTFTTQTTTNTYNEVSKEVKEAPEKFLSLLKVDPDNINPKTGKPEFNLYNLNNNTDIIKYKNSSGRLESPENSLLSAKEFLYELLATNTKTANAKLDETMRYLLDLYTGETNLDENRFSMYEPGGFLNYKFNSTGGIISPFGCNISKQDFIEAARKYCNTSAYQNNMMAYIEDFYDISVRNNVNPVITFAWACVETANGDAIPYNNYFGMGIANGASSGKRYNTPADSIQDFCNWVIDSGTPGSSTYNMALAKAQLYATANSSFEGDPSNNIYALYAPYMFLGYTHICDEPDFNNPNVSYYQSHGSTWGAGGRIYLPYIYGSDYPVRCGHSRGTDLTTTAEQADYAEWAINKKVNIAKDIFGDYISSVENKLTPEQQRIIVEWAEEQIGKSGYINTMSGNYMNCENLCSGFVMCAYYKAGLGWYSTDAIGLPHDNEIPRTADGKVDYEKIPVGAVIVSRGGNPVYGHVCLYVGDGYVIEGGGKVVVKHHINIDAWYQNSFLGWGYATHMI